jgi:methylated-DNA-[protein]-cysteine S-methyltransferase
MKVAYTFFDTGLGTLYAAATERGLCALSLSSKSEEDFVKYLKSYTGCECERDDSLAWQLVKFVRRYLSRDVAFFSFSLDISFGTEFQQKVWQATQKVGYGTTTTYGEIAKRIGNARAARAVGQALRKNPILIAIPCHRVLGKDGKLTGFGCGLKMKEKLLQLERTPGKFS